MSKQKKEIKSLTADELAKRIRDLEGKVFQTRMQKVTGQLEDTASLWRNRKELARLKTAQTARVTDRVKG